MFIENIKGNREKKKQEKRETNADNMKIYIKEEAICFRELTRSHIL